MANDNVLAFLLQNALSLARPSAPASNQVLYQVALEDDTVSVVDTMQAEIIPVGYPYGWGESIAVNESANGTYTYSLTEPEAVAWLIKMNSYQPSGPSVTFQATVGGGTQQTLSPVSPAVACIYGDIFKWSKAASLGQVGISPWSTPSSWTDSSAWWVGPDTSATSADAVGQWLLRKWILCSSSDQYTIYAAGDALATVYVDGTQVVQANGYASTSKGTVTLNEGLHLVTVEVLNYGTAPNPTGLLISIQDSQGNIIENGASQQWETTGYINHPWSLSSGAPLMTDSWYVIDEPASTSVSVSLTLSGTPAPTVNNLWWYSVAPWKWGRGGEYNAAANSALPITVTKVGSA